MPPRPSRTTTKIQSVPAAAAPTIRVGLDWYSSIAPAVEYHAYDQLASGVPSVATARSPVAPTARLAPPTSALTPPSVTSVICGFAAVPSAITTSFTATTAGLIATVACTLSTDGTIGGSGGTGSGAVYVAVPSAFATTAPIGGTPVKVGTSVHATDGWITPPSSAATTLSRDVAPAGITGGSAITARTVGCASSAGVGNFSQPVATTTARAGARQRNMSRRQYGRPPAPRHLSPAATTSVYAPAPVFWTIFFSVVGTLFLVSIVLPVPRRVWAFNLRAAKYFLLWVSDVLRLRKLWFAITGKSKKYARLTRPQLIRMFCEDMGPTFIKFGQIVASSGGMFPEAYVKEFQKCLDRVRPFAFAQVQQTLIDELGTEKAAQLKDVEPKPLASASIAQVHTATLADGTLIVVKVQRPGIIKRCESDMKIMRVMARVLARVNSDAELANPVGLIDDFTATLEEELDFRKEAANLDRFNDIMKELDHKNIKAPVPHHALTTRKVLVMERFVGVRVDHYDEIRARGINGEEKLVAGLRAWFQCVVFYGFFHGDVHAGNLMLLDSEDIGFLDFGIVGRFDEKARWLVTDYMIAFSTGNYRRLADIICEMGGAEPGAVDMDAFVKDLGETYSPLLTLSFGEVNYADFIPGIQKTATRHRVKMPKEFILITKQLLYFDRYAKALAPKLNVFTDPRLVLGMMQDIQKARMDYDKKQKAAGAA